MSAGASRGRRDDMAAPRANPRSCRVCRRASFGYALAGGAMSGESGPATIAADHRRLGARHHGPCQLREGDGVVLDGVGAHEPVAARKRRLQKSDDKLAASSDVKSNADSTSRRCTTDLWRPAPMRPTGMDVTEGWNCLMRICRPGRSVLEGASTGSTATGPVVVLDRTRRLTEPENPTEHVSRALYRPVREPRYPSSAG